MTNYKKAANCLFHGHKILTETQHVIVLYVKACFKDCHYSHQKYSDTTDFVVK